MFDAANHPLLSAEAKALDIETLGAQTRLAEVLLNLDTEAYDALTEAQKHRWAEAVVMQINYTVLRGIEGETYNQESTTGFSRSFRKAGPVSAIARLLRDVSFGDSAGFHLSGCIPNEEQP